MKRIFFNLRRLLSQLTYGLLLFALSGCIAPAQPVFSPTSDEVNRNIDPESAAMEAFARANLMSIDGDLKGSLAAIEQAIAIDPESAFLYMSKGEILFQMGELDLARKALEATLLRDPDQSDAYLALSEVQTLLGDHPAAVESLVAAKRLQPDDPQITLYLALAHARNQEISTAITLLETLIEETPEDINPHLALARIYLIADSPLLAVDTYQTLLKIAPEHEQATLELGSLYLQTEKSEEAVILYSRYLERSPKSSRTRYQLVRIFLDRNRLDLALEQLTVIVQQNPDDLDALHRIGLIYLQQQKMGLAEQQFRELLTRSPVAANYYALGIALEAEEKWEEAITVFGQITVDSEQFPDAVIHRAYLLPKLGRNQEAITLLEAHLSKLEPMPELYEFIASLYAKEKNWPAAEQALLDGLAQFPEHPTLLMRQAFLLDQSGKTAASLLPARKVLSLDPNHAEALNFIAYSYAVQNVHLEEAESMVLKALELADAPHIRDTYGWVLYRMQRFEAALVELKSAIDGIPDDPTVLEHLADIYVALGMNKEALTVYQQILNGGRSDNSTLIQQKIDGIQSDSAK